MIQLATTDEIDLYGRMMIALLKIETCQDVVSLIPEVRMNMVYAQPHATIPDEVLAIDGRITIVNSMPHAAGRIRFGASSHMARLFIELMKIEPSARAGINFKNPSGFSIWLSDYCAKRGWIYTKIDRKNEPVITRITEGSTMQWKAGEVVRSTGGKVPKIICDTGGMGKEPMNIIIGDEPVSIAQDLCKIAWAYVQSLQ